jgi:outer membrane protein TolC
MNRTPVPGGNALSLALLCLLSGCASTAIDQQHAALGQFSAAQFDVKPARLSSEADRQAARAWVDSLLQQPLTEDGAIRIALAYSPAYQVLLADQTAASARITQSARLPNPVFAFERLLREGGAARELEINRSLSFALLDVLLLPRTLQLADMRQQQLQLQAAAELLRTVTEVRQAWVQAVAAQQRQAYFKQVMDAAEASAELAKRMQAAGNFSRLQQAREQAFYADAQSQLVRARLNADSTRENLVRKLGLDDTQQHVLKLPDSLPPLPAVPQEEGKVLHAAIDDRLDVQLAKAELNQVAKSEGLVTVTSYVNGLQLKGERNSATGQPVQKGYEVEFPLPLFDWGDARREEVRARYLAALNRTAQTALNARSQTRQAYGAYRAAYDLALHYQNEIVPLRKAIADEMLLNYNGMLIGVFELLADAREQIGSVIGALDAQRDFWLADATLRASLLGQAPGLTGMEAQLMNVAADSGAAH